MGIHEPVSYTHLDVYKRQAIGAIKKRTGRAPRAATADRSYGEPGIEDGLRQLGVRYVVLPTKGKPNATRRRVENRRAFKTMVRWRTGCEGRISLSLIHI